MKEERVTFKSGELTLEGLLASPAPGNAARAAVVCHPHPLYGGSMYNNVVEAILDALWALEFATLRFNFRGVGQSQGTFAGGAGEALDVAAAVRFIIADQAPGDGLALVAGYSFGAMVGLRAGCELPEVRTVLAVAPPLARTDLSFSTGGGRRILLLAGDRDPYCPAEEIRALHARMAGAGALSLLAAADHFFAGREAELSALIRDLLAD